MILTSSESSARTVAAPFLCLSQVLDLTVYLILPYIHIYCFSSLGDTMPQPPGTGTTHHCPGAKVKVYVKMGPCAVVRGCCRTHQLQCQEPLRKGWIYMNRDNCIKCEARAEVSIGTSAWKTMH